MGPVLGHCLRSKWASAVCLLVVIAALALPPGGFGFPTCQFKEFTRLPCPGCGLTRSFIGMAHLDVARAGFYHPVGVILFPVVFLLAALLALPRRFRDGAARWAERHSVLVSWLFGGLLAFFVAHGVGRIVWLLATRQPSPW